MSCKNQLNCCPSGPFSKGQPGPVAVYWSAVQSASASCPTGTTGGPFTATIPAATYYSYLSQVDADAQAMAAAVAQANLLLTGCIPPLPGSMDGLLWLLPCDNPTDPCDCTDPVDQSVVMSGTPGHIYTATLRVRGVAEMVEYVGGSVSPYTGFVYLNPTGPFYPGNSYILRVSSPAAAYFLNNETGGVGDLKVVECTFKIPIAGGAIVTLQARANDGTENRNSAGHLANNVPPLPSAIQGVSGATPYDGQFMQILIQSIDA